MQQHLTRLAPLFVGHDERLWELPAELLAARAAAERLREALAALPVVEPLAELEERRVGELLDAARSGTDLPSPAAGLAERVAELADRHRAADLLDRAAALADSELSEVFAPAADALLTGPLTAAMDTLWGEVQERVALLAEYGPNISAEKLIAAPAKARRAWQDFDDLAATYGRLRSVGAVIRRTTGRFPDYDHAGEFVEFVEGVAGVWPAWRHSTNKPWPADGRGRLLWIAGSGLTPWLPTVAQQDERWMDAHADQYETAQRGRQSAAAVHSWGDAYERTTGPTADLTLPGAEGTE